MFFLSLMNLVFRNTERASSLPRAQPFSAIGLVERLWNSAEHTSLISHVIEFPGRPGEAERCPPAPFV